MVQDVFHKVFLSNKAYNSQQPGATFCGWPWTITQKRRLRPFSSRIRTPRRGRRVHAQLLLKQVPAAEPEDCTSGAGTIALLNESLQHPNCMIHVTQDLPICTASCHAQFGLKRYNRSRVGLSSIWWRT